MVTLLSRYSEQIIDAWHEMARESLQIPLADDDLRAWLQKYYMAFIEQIKDPSDLRADEIFSDFSALLQESGAPVSKAIEVLYLISHAVVSFWSARLQTADADFTQENLSRIRSLVIHVMARNSERYTFQAAEENQRQQDRTATLLRVAKAASSSLDLETVIRAISEEIVQALNAYACNSFLFPEHSKYGHYFILDPVPPPGYHVPDPPEPFGLDALRSGEPVICYDAALDPRTDKETVRFFGLKSLMAFPFNANGKTVAAGLIVMKDYHHFTQEEIDLVMGIANTTAVAIENAQLFERSKRLAIAEERNRLSMEMHDNLAQALAIMKIGINSLLSEDMSEPAQSTLHEMKSLVNETYIDLRDTIFGLRAVNESDAHFLDSFRSYLETFSVHSNLEIEFAVSEAEIKLLSKEALLQLGRILEEALTNARKHARAQNVWIRSSVEGNSVVITVEDDGVGIAPQDLRGKPREGHFGLRMMAERAGSAGGKLRFSNRAAGGACVRLEIPFGHKYSN